VFTIGPFSRLAGVSPKVLRSYDGLGLFRPVWLDRATGYRYYSPAQLPELRRISALRNIGMGVAEIAALVRGGADLATALERRRQALAAERAEIDERIAALDIRIREGSADTAADVVLRPIPSELVAVRAVLDDEDDAAAFHELESHVRDENRRARRPPGALVHGRSWEIFVPVTGAVTATGRIEVRPLPACRAATLIVRGAYEGLEAGRRALVAWVRAAGLDQAGPLRILYLQFGAEAELRIPAGYVVPDGDAFVTELQLPVSGVPDEA
jgi:DNA-binding transcriptional MerR regulator